MAEFVTLPRAMSDSIVPTCFTQASCIPEWRTTMTEQFNALLKNGTWSTVPFHPTQNLVGCKLVFRIKRNADDSVESYKARLVA